MRIIAGLAKGRKLIAPRSFSVRPVSDKVKGAIFNILGPLDGETVLDLFAGSGSVGLEALSRGATKVVFVDVFHESLQCLQKNTAACGFEKQVVILKGKIPEVLKKIKNHPPFSLIFVDPPYDKNLINPALEGLCINKLIDAQTTLIIEHSPRETPSCEELSLVDQRKYGQTLVSFLKVNEELRHKQRSINHE